MDNFEQFIQLISGIIKDISYFISEAITGGFISGLISYLVGFLKMIAQFIIIALEALIKLLQFFVNL
ncbi:MAG: hypothetical protein PHF45_01315 [Candidatus Pacebacteria bacterium]|nr:hypothetical protein [Candidatus Paceibacterota bacterium]